MSARLRIALDTDAAADEACIRPAGPLSIALASSGLRCLFVYIVLPVFAPLLGAFVALALPVVLALYGIGIAASVRAVIRCGRSGRAVATATAVMLVLFNLLSLTVLLGRVSG